MNQITKQDTKELYTVPYQKLAEALELRGLIKLIAKDNPTLRLCLFSPNRKERSFLKFPSTLIREDEEKFRILHAYTPNQYQISFAEMETYLEFKDRIEQECMKTVNYVHKNNKKVNAFYIANLKENYVIRDNLIDGNYFTGEVELGNEITKNMNPYENDSLLNEIAKEIVVKKLVFDLCLYEIQ